MQGLDYSAARLSGQAIRSAGYDFVIRYVGTPGRMKNIIASEYNDLIAADVAVALVYENVAEDALGGFAAGQGAARAARADADSIGFPANRPIYFAVDWVATGPQMPAVMAYLNGAADVLGVDRVGVYGFQLTVRTAMDGGHARWFWQCGARSALVPGTHLYQHNNDNTSVSGITCDVNDALQPDFGQNTGVTDMTPEEHAMLVEIRNQLCGSPVPGEFPGWDTWDGTGRKLTPVDLLREAHRETNQRIPSRVPGSTYTDTVLGYAANSDMYGYQANQALGQVLQLLGQQHGVSAQDIATALAPLLIAALPGHLNKLSADDLQAIAKAVADEETRRMAGHPTTGNAPGSNPTPAASAMSTPAPIPAPSTPESGGSIPQSDQYTPPSEGGL